MGKYILKRVLLLIPSILVVSIITFALMRLIPGSAVDVIQSRYSGMGITVEDEEIRAQLGLDKPAIQQSSNILSGWGICAGAIWGIPCLNSSRWPPSSPKSCPSPWSWPYLP